MKSPAGGQERCKCYQDVNTDTRHEEKTKKKTVESDKRLEVGV